MNLSIHWLGTSRGIFLGAGGTAVINSETE